MNEPIILNETEDQSRRMVQLDAWHEIDRDGSVSVLITAAMTQAGVKIRRMSSAEPQEHFYMDANVADAFCKAWTDFRNIQEANAKAEQEQQAQIIAEAYALAGKHSTIQIEECGNSTWVVTESKTGWNCHSHYRSYGAADLLKDTKEARAALHAHIGTLSGGDAA